VICRGVDAACRRAYGPSKTARAICETLGAGNGRAHVACKSVESACGDVHTIRPAVIAAGGTLDGVFRAGIATC
jgi:hypothetical protein